MRFPGRAREHRDSGCVEGWAWSPGNGSTAMPIRNGRSRGLGGGVPISCAGAMPCGSGIMLRRMDS
eukprot:10147940-Alexandrium_andersonii.AAC.1